MVELRRLERDLVDSPHSSMVSTSHSEGASGDQHSMPPGKQSHPSLSTGNKNKHAKNKFLKEASKKCPFYEVSNHSLTFASLKISHYVTKTSDTDEQFPHYLVLKKKEHILPSISLFTRYS